MDRQLPKTKDMDWTQFEFRAAPGEIEELNCGVCYSVMKVEQNVGLHTSFAAALSGKSELRSVFDRYLCPHCEEGWHKQVVAIRKEADQTSSARLRDLLIDESNEIVCTRETTIHGYS